MSEATQGTADWLQARLGYATASNFATILTKGRGKGKEWGDTAMTHALTLVAERLTGEGEPEFTAAACDWGNANEPFAVAAYEAAQGVYVEPASFIRHPLIDWVGGSPDGLVAQDGLIEAKCPHKSHNHLRTVWTGKMPAEHTAQVQGNLWITGREWCDFVSFDPRLPESCQLFVTRVERDAAFIETLGDRVEAFLALVNQILEGCHAAE